MKWVTRERARVDRIACPWLITRFIDPAPEFLFVPAREVLAVSEREGAIPYDVPERRARPPRPGAAPSTPSSTRFELADPGPGHARRHRPRRRHRATAALTPGVGRPLRRRHRLPGHQP